MATTDQKITCMQFLKSKDIAVLSTVSSTGQPMGSTIYFVVDEQFTFYFMTKGFTRKHENIEHNAKVAFVVGTENEPVTVQIEGRAEKITDASEFAKRFDQIEAIFLKNEYVAPLFQLTSDKNSITMYRVIPTWIRMLDLRADKNKVDSGFTQIL